MLGLRLRLGLGLRLGLRIDVTPVFEAMMEKGQDQIPDEGFLMTKTPRYFIVTVDTIILCLGVLLL
jgi:hypothetical protein